MSRRWKTFWCLWLACFVPLVWSIYTDDNPELIQGTALAHLDRIQGRVSLRPEGQMVWRKATKGQKLYANDLVATEKNGQAIIQFLSGKKLQLSPESVVRLSLPNPLSKDFEVSVLKGRLTVKPEPVKMGLAAKVSPAVEAQVIFKTTPPPLPPPQIVPVTQPRAPNPYLGDAHTSGESLAQLAAIPMPRIEPCKLPDPLPPVVKEEEVEDILAKPSVPRMDEKLLPKISPQSGEFWTLLDWSAVELDSLDFKVSWPSYPSHAQYQGLVRISGKNGEFKIEGRDSKRSDLGLKFKQLVSSNVLKNPAEDSFVISTGYSIQSPEFLNAIELFSPRSSSFKLHSFANDGGLTLGFDSLNWLNTSAPWSFVEPLAHSRIQIGVVAGSDRHKIFGFIEGNKGRVQKLSWNGMPAIGTFIIRDHAIVASIDGERLTQSDYKKLATLFKGNMVYRGSYVSFINKEQIEITKLSQAHAKLFAYKAGEFIEVDTNLLKVRPNALKLILSSSTFLFREPVEVLFENS